MTPSILIVDPSHSFANLLRAKLVTCGATAHIFASYKAALMVLESKKIDSDFCKVVRTLRVPLIYVASNQANIAIDAVWSVGGTHAISRGWHPHF